MPITKPLLRHQDFSEKTSYIAGISAVGKFGPLGLFGEIRALKQSFFHARGKLEDSRFREWPSDTSWGRRAEGGSVMIRSEKDLDKGLMEWIRRAFEIGRRP